VYNEHRSIAIRGMAVVTHNSKLPRIPIALCDALLKLSMSHDPSQEATRAVISFEEKCIYVLMCSSTRKQTKVCRKCLYNIFKDLTLYGQS